MKKKIQKFFLLNPEIFKVQFRSSKSLVPNSAIFIQNSIFMREIFLR